jgi:hypothetical protein
MKVFQSGTVQAESKEKPYIIRVILLPVPASFQHAKHCKIMFLPAIFDYFYNVLQYAKEEEPILHGPADINSIYKQSINVRPPSFYAKEF